MPLFVWKKESGKYNSIAKGYLSDNSYYENEINDENIGKLVSYLKFFIIILKK